MFTALVRRLMLAAVVFTSLALTEAHAGNGRWTVIGWNNLGMHCMDDDYSVFSILPPFNTVDVHLLDAGGKLVKSVPPGVTVSFTAVADPDGSINCTSVGKSNFWQHSQALFGVDLPADTGLTGVRMPGAANTPQPLGFDETRALFEAAGVPIVPRDDEGQVNPYPLVRIAARNAAGAELAHADVVLPVSSEMDCRSCHGSGAGAAARPAAGWVNDPHPSRDYRLNILRLHDERHLGSAVHSAALAAAGYSAEGLFQTVQAGGKSILCASCHSSEALGTGGAAGVPPLTRAMHAKHAGVVSAANGLPLGASGNRGACYQCHPGSATRCLRGAMGSATAADGSAAMQCQSCHGGMSEVGAASRTGWLDEPGCGSCHTGSATANAGKIRFDSVFDAPGHVRQPVLATFATTPDTPAAGKSLYRFSTGHGGLQCSACHGSTHAEFPASHRNDNLASLQLQGHVGVLADCTACHATMPKTVTGGPHGMHPISLPWAKDHADSARAVGLANCRSCHGSDYRGTVLSRALGDRSWTTKFGTKTLKRGMEVSCYLCHNGPNSSNSTPRTAPVVASSQISLPVGGTGTVSLTASGTGATVRLVQPPLHGTVAFAGLAATYRPDPGYAGPDSFTYLATDSAGYLDSAPATVSLTVGPTDDPADDDHDGLDNFLEYALGLDPFLASPPGLWGRREEILGGLHYQSLVLPRGPLLPPDAAVTIRVSPDLSLWAPATPIGNSASELRARDPVPMESAPRRFIRADVTRPTP